MGAGATREERRSMTVKKDLKRRVRERQARTGESYAAARAQVVAQAPKPAEPEPVAEPAAEPVIAVEELIDLTPQAQAIGIKCQVAMTSRLAGRIDPDRTLIKIRDALLATDEDPDTRTLRAVVLRGEHVVVPMGARAADWFGSARRFVARALAGIGGISEHGNMLAISVDGPAGSVMLIAHVWLRPFGMRREAPRLMLSVAESVGHPSGMWTLLR
jgi:hypothetical protein